MPKRFGKRDKIQALSNLSLFESCTQKELSQVASISVESERSPGTILTREGRDGGLMFIILDGKAEVYTGDGSRRKVLKTLGPSDVVGELSLIDGKPRSASVRAASDVHLLQIARDDFAKLVDSSPHFVLNLLRALSLRVREMDALTT